MLREEEFREPEDVRLAFAEPRLDEVDALNKILAPGCERLLGWVRNVLPCVGNLASWRLWYTSAMSLDMTTSCLITFCTA